MLYNSVFSPGPFGRAAPYAFTVSLTLMREGNQLVCKLRPDHAHPLCLNICLGRALHIDIDRLPKPVNYIPSPCNDYPNYPYTAELLKLNNCTETNSEVLPAYALRITTPLVATPVGGTAQGPPRQTVCPLSHNRNHARF